MTNNNNNPLKITREDIFLDLAILLTDTYNGKVERDTDKIHIYFDNGQNFVIETKESHLA